MVQGRATLLILMLLLIGACNANTPNDASLRASNNPTNQAKQDASAMANDHQRIAVVKPPSPSSMLYLIYQKDGDGALSYEVEDGSRATYWYGYPFDLGGKHYFTGFAYQTPARYGKQYEEGLPAPDAKVTLTQATVVAVDPGAEKPWAFQGNQYYVGEFGGYEKGNEIDETRQPHTYKTTSGKLLLAIPTWYLSSGTRISSFDVFLFNPDELTKLDDMRWAYLGNIVTGEDNGAACNEDEGATMPCVKSSGALSFVPQDGIDLPLIRIAMSGTEIVSPGKTRVLGSEDGTEHHYDPAKKQYL